MLEALARFNLCDTVEELFWALRLLASGFFGACRAYTLAVVLCSIFVCLIKTQKSSTDWRMM